MSKQETSTANQHTSHDKNFSHACTESSKKQGLLIRIRVRWNNFFQMFKESATEFKNTRTLVLCAMMAALSIILSYTTSFYITPTIKIGFSGLPNRLVDFMFGPVVGAFFGGLLDVLKFIIKPDGGFFFGYVLTAMAGGLIYGCFYYHLQIKKPYQTTSEKSGTTDQLTDWFLTNLKALLLIFIANALVKILCNIGMNTLWSSMLTGKAFLAILPARVVKNLIQIPVDTVVHFVLLKVFCQLKRFLLPDTRRH